MPDDLRAYGWAPGCYMIFCAHCEKRVEDAAKRAWRCESCAKLAKEGAEHGGR